jgi:uncharacterized integral membrane protein
MALIRAIAGLILALLFAVFAVANRQAVDIVWSPVDPPLNLPLYVVALGALAVGFLSGGFMVWLGTLPGRLERGRQSRQIQKLEKELGVKDSTITIQKPKTMVQDLTLLPPKEAAE